MNATTANAVTAIDAALPAPAASLHLALFMADGRILGDETFRVERFEGTEAINEPFEFKLELRAETARRGGHPLSFEDILGRSVTLGVRFPVLDERGQPPAPADALRWFRAGVAGVPQGMRFSFFNGIVASFCIAEPGVYRLTMRPALWRLTLANAYRVFSQMSVRDAIAALLAESGIEADLQALDGTDNLASARVQDWFQAGESDDEFLKRLMSKAHVYYFFRSTGRSHQVVFANRPAYPHALPDGRPLRYCDTSQGEDGPIQADVISSYSLEQSLSSRTVNVVLTTEDSASAQDPLASCQTYRSTSTDDVGRGFRQHLIHRYGGSAMEAEQVASATRDRMASASRRFAGTSNCAFLRAGHQFDSTQSLRGDSARDPVTPVLQGQSWAVLQVEHKASADGRYQNQFISAPAAGLVTPVSLQETQQGSVLAQVVAIDPGTHAPTDWRFYAPNACDGQTQPLLDAEAQPVARSFAGVCVALSTDPDGSPPVWIALSCAMETVPEIGAMVLVARSADQSELPEIQAIVSSHGNKTVTPSGWIPSTTVGSSYSTSYGDSLSIRFGRSSQVDLSQAQQIVVGQYGTQSFREASFAQGASYSYATSENGRDGLLSQSDAFGSTLSNAIGASSTSTSTFDDTRNTSLVNGTAENVSTVLGLSKNTTAHGQVENLTTIGTSSSTDSTGISTSISATVAATNLSAVGTRQQISLEGSSQSFSQIGESVGQTVCGMNTQVNATGTSSTVEVTGTSTHLSQVGSESSLRLVGNSTNSTLTGTSESSSLVGVQLETSIVGDSTRCNAALTSTSMTSNGSETDIHSADESVQITMKAYALVVDMTAEGFRTDLGAGLQEMEVRDMAVKLSELSIFL